MVKWLIKILGGVPHSAYVDLQSKTMDLRSKNTELIDQNYMLKVENKSLKSELEAALNAGITSGTDDLKDGISHLDTGKIYAVFNRGAML